MIYLPGSAATFPANVRIPEGIDRRNSTNFAGGFEDLANRTACLRARTPGVATPCARHVMLNDAISVAIGSVWTYSGGAGADVNYWSQAQASNNRLLFDITHLLPPLCTITGYRVVIDPADGHGGWPTQPTIELLRRSMFQNPGVAWTQLSAASDGAVSLGGYESPHYLGPNNVSIAVDHSAPDDPYRYAIAVTGELGANYMQGLMIYAAFVVVAP